jgi:hypothetical protein
MQKDNTMPVCFAVYFIVMALAMFAVAMVLPYGSAESLLILCLGTVSTILAVAASLASH